MSRIKNDDDPILRDGEALRVSMTMMDAQQRAVADQGKFGSLGPGNMAVSKVAEVPPTFVVDPFGERGAWSGNGTRELPPRKGPPRKAESKAYSEYIERTVSAWKTK